MLLSNSGKRVNSKAFVATIVTNVAMLRILLDTTVLSVLYGENQLPLKAYQCYI